MVELEEEPLPFNQYSSIQFWWNELAKAWVSSVWKSQGRLSFGLKSLDQQCFLQIFLFNLIGMDSPSRSDDRIDGFPQQLWWKNWWIPPVGRMLKLPISGFPQQVGWQNWWIPPAALMTELVDSPSRSDDTWFLFSEFWTLWPDFWPTLGLFGENCLL